MENLKDKQFWNDQIDKQQSSGLSSKKYCIREGLIYTRFLYHRRSRNQIRRKKASFTQIKTTQSKVSSQVQISVGDAKISFASLPDCLLYTSPSPRDRQKSRMPSSA